MSTYRLDHLFAPRSIALVGGSLKSNSVGGNTLRATGIKLGKGDKVVAVLNNVEGKTVTVRFTVK